METRRALKMGDTSTIRGLVKLLLGLTINLFDQIYRCAFDLWKPIVKELRTTLLGHEDVLVATMNAGVFQSIADDYNLKRGIGDVR